MADDSNAETAEESSSTSQTEDVSCYLKVVNADHVIELVSNGEGLGIKDLIEIAKNEMHALCEALPVQGAVQYEPKEGIEERDDPSVH